MVPCHLNFSLNFLLSYINFSVTSPSWLQAGFRPLKLVCVWKHVSFSLRLVIFNEQTYLIKSHIIPNTLHFAFPCIFDTIYKVATTVLSEKIPGYQKAVNYFQVFIFCCQAQPQLQLKLWLRLVLVPIPPKPPNHPPTTRPDK